MADNKNNINYKITVDTDSGTASIRELNGQIVAGAVPLDKLRSKFGNFAKTVNAADFNKFNKGLKASTAELENANKQTGAATSATLEFGRVLSDAPYGIRGVANNVQQLASNLFFMGKQVDATTGKTIGFKGAIGSLIKNLAGPAGVLVAFQGVIALFDYFSTSTKKAEDSTNKANESIGGQATKLLALKDALEDSSMSREEANEAVEEANKEFKELNLKLDENNQLTDDSVVAINNKIEALVNLSKAQALQSLLEQKYSELLPLQSKQQDLDTEAKKANAQAMKQLNTLDKRFTAETQINNAARAESAAKENARAVKKIEKDISDLLKLGGEDGIIDLMFKGTKKTKGSSKVKKISPFATPKELEIDIKNAENAIIQYERKIEDARLKKELNDKLSEAKTEEEKAKIRRNYEKDRLINQINAERESLKLKKSTEEEVVKTKVANHKAELKRKHREFVYSVKLKEKLGEITSQQSSDLISQSDELTNKSMSQADKEAEKSVKQIREKYKPLFALFESLAGSRLDALFSMPTKDKKDEDSDLEFGIKQYMILQSSLTDFLNGEYDRQLTIEQNKTNAMNNQLRERLNNENLSAEERKSIQLQIAKNDEELRKKQEKIEKKRFKVQKAINIANALVDTYRSGVMAFGSQLVIGDPTSPIRAQIAQGVAIAAGLANVAMIARQKFQSTAGGAPTAGALGGGGSGGGDNTREFNFNLAGSTQSNQLTQSIAGQLSQPIQTYVVSSEITSQQQLDLNIANTATIGG